MDDMKERKLKNFLKATLPIAEGMDLDACINANLYLATYISKVTHDHETPDYSKRAACAMVASMFDYETIHFLEEVIREFYDEKIFGITEV